MAGIRIIPRKAYHENNSNVRLEYTPIEGLKFSAIGAYNFTNAQDKKFRATLPVTINGATVF